MTLPYFHSRSERGDVVLRQRPDADAQGADGPVWELRVNETFVMDSAQTSSERELARVALSLTNAPGIHSPGTRSARRVLIGGLGLGFTLAEVLADPRPEEITVVEIEAAVARRCVSRWSRTPGGPACPSRDR
jgi:spermidine synthase